MTLRPREFCRFLLLFVSLGGGIAWAAPAIAPSSATPAPAKYEATGPGDAAELRARVERARARTDVTPAERSLVFEQLDFAQARLDSAAAAEKKAAEYLEILRTAPDTIAALSEQSALAPPTPVDTHANVDLIEGQLELASLQAKAVSLRGQQRALEESLQTMSTRQAPAHEELAEMRRDLDEPQPALAANASTVLVEASRLRAESIRRDLSARIEMTEQELLTLPIRESMASARRDLLARQLQATEAAILALQTNLGGRREEAAARRSQEARDEAQRLVDGPPAVRNFATHTAELRASAATLDEKVEANRLAQVGLLARRNEIAEARRNAEQVLATGQIGNQHARMLRGFGQDLPTQDALRRRIAHREREIVDGRLQRIQLQQELHQLDEVDTAARTVLTNAGVPTTAEWLATMTRLVESRRAALVDLQALRTRQIDGLAEANAGDAELLGSTTQLRTLLDQRLLWLPSGTPLDGAWLHQLYRGWGWMSARDSWAQVPASLGASLWAHPLALILVVALLAGLVAARPPMKRALEHSAAAVGARDDRFSSTVLALVFALLHALPWPLAFAALGLALDASESTGAFANTFGVGLLGAAVVLYMVGVFQAMCAPHGLFVAHFRWEAEGTRRLDRTLRRLELVLVPTTLIIAMANAETSSLHPEGWGRLGLMVGAVSLALVPVRVLGPRHGIFTKALSRTGLLWRSRYVWFVVLVAIPLLLAVLAAAGYQATASDLQARLFTSGWSVLAVIIAYRIAMRGVLVAGRRAAFEQADSRRAKARLARESVDGALSMRSEEAALDVVSVSLQTRSLLRAAAAVMLVALSWSIWKAIVPALEVLNDVALWSRPGGEGAVTLADAGLSVLTLGLTWIAARNLPGFLEIALLQQLRIDAGTRYAVTTIARYAIVAVGMVIVLRWVGADWSKLQWLLAALSVGLGFGLQEIVANFVSGIIILFERPVRVGDTISIGSTLGTVSRIQIRAITLLDADNLEVVVPNKSFITQSVQNWSLSSSITRIVVKVGVGYGCDPLEARRILLEVATANPNVLVTPAPSALFLGFGDSALQFELRAFVGAIDQRLSTLDALHAAVHRALGDAGIEIPFPQRDVHVRATAPEEAPSASAPVVDGAP